MTQTDLTYLPSNKADLWYVLRGIAILCVFCLHSVIVLRAAMPQVQFPGFLFLPAWAAMWMLFALSGYLLGRKFYSHQCDSWQDIGIFWKNRALRILPSYYIFLLLVFLFVAPAAFLQEKGLFALRLLTCTYNGIPGLEGVGATWFVSVIIQLYLVAPLIYKFLLKKCPLKYSWILFWGLVIAGLVVRLCSQKVDYYKWIYTFSPANWDLFFAPFVLNAFVYVDSPDNKLKKILRYLLPILLCVAIGICAFIVYKEKYWWYYQYIFPTVFLVIMSGFIYSYNRKTNKKRLPLSMINMCKNPLRLLEGFGMVSFSFYLYHSNILGVMPKILPAGISDGWYVFWGVTGGFVLSLLWGCIMWLFVEKTCNSIRYRLTQPK